MTLKWEDVTAYHRGESPRVPRAWRIQHGGLVIWIGNSHVDNPGRWTMHCRTLNLDTVDLGLSASESVELAQALAIQVVQHNIGKLVADVAVTISATIKDTPRSDDLVERLSGRYRAHPGATLFRDDVPATPIMLEAAARILALEAEVARLKGA